MSVLLSTLAKSLAKAYNLRKAKNSIIALTLDICLYHLTADAVAELLGRGFEEIG